MKTELHSSVSRKVYHSGLKLAEHFEMVKTVDANEETSITATFDHLCTQKEIYHHIM